MIIGPYIHLHTHTPIGGSKTQGKIAINHIQLMTMLKLRDYSSPGVNKDNFNVADNVPARQTMLPVIESQVKVTPASVLLATLQCTEQSAE